MGDGEASRINTNIADVEEAQLRTTPLRTAKRVCGSYLKQSWHHEAIQVSCQTAANVGNTAGPVEVVRPG